MNVKILPLVLVCAACATSRNEFSTTGPGTVAAGAECVMAELLEDGWVAAYDEGVVSANMGTHRVEATLVQGQELSTSYLLQITTTNTDPAREMANELVAECGA
jgi:hypothetical protein